MNTFLRRRRCLCLELLEARCVPSTVTNLSDHDAGSLRDAIATSPVGATVDFQPGLSGTIVLTTGELGINKDLTIEGPGASVITVSGNHASRVFNIGNVTAAISGLAIVDGMVMDGDGGGIDNAGTLTVTSSIFSGNSAPYGGGIGNGFGTLTVTASTFSGNSADYGGGGINNQRTATVTASVFTGNSVNAVAGGRGGGIDNGGTLTITDSTFSGNENGVQGGATYEIGAIYNDGGMTVTASTFNSNVGGGIFSDVGTLAFIDCTFAGDDGGGIINAFLSTLTVSHCTFSGNTAEFGGGIDNGGTLTITDSTFSGNLATSYSEFDGAGGGISSHGILAITDSTINGNSARFGGGIASDGALSLSGCTINGNSAMYGGGIGMAVTNGALLTMRNSIIAGNRDQGEDPDLFLRNIRLITNGHNLIGDGDPGDGYAATDLVGTSANPIDPLLGPLQDNGGPTWTMALLPGSPAIGAGGPTDSEWDQREPGYSRSLNGTTDIGAYEVQPSAAGSAALTVHSPERAHPVPPVALSSASAPGVLLRRAAVALDQVFASWTSKAVQAGRSKHATKGEPVLWVFDHPF
jgi:hypothetical protein